MDNVTFTIPDIKFTNDFTIIYKGREEKIIEIRASRDELVRRIQFFKKQINEIKHINEYYIHDEFDTKTFYEFINSLNTKQIVINDKNYFEFLKLSQKYEYKEIQEIVQEFIKERPDLTNIINQIAENGTENIDFEKEKIISQHLDFFLDHNLLFKLPVFALNRILNSPDRVIHDHHLLFRFIKEKITQINQQKEKEKNDKENVEIMISSLDINEMSREEINEFLQLEKVEHIFDPRNSTKFIKTILESNQKLEERVAQLEQNQSEETKHIEIKFKEYEEQIEQQKKSKIEEKKQFEEQIKKHEEQIEQLEKSKIEEKKQFETHIKKYEVLINKINEIENKFESQSKLIANYEKELKQPKKLVENITINTKTEASSTSKTIILTADVEPKDAINKRVSWNISNEIPNTVEVLDEDGQKIRIKINKGNQTISITATSVDENKVTVKKNLKIFLLKGEIDANVDSNQVIKGAIKLNDEGNILDKSKSKFILNTDDSSKLGVESYSNGTNIEAQTQSFSFIKLKGTYYLHALIVDKEGHSYELVSGKLSTAKTVLTYDYTGSPQTVELEKGEYKLEVWGAQGGTSYFHKEISGGKGGYSVGTIRLDRKTKLYVYVGGQGKGRDTSGLVEGGFNGGGYRHTNK